MQYMRGALLWLSHDPVRHVPNRQKQDELQGMKAQAAQHTQLEQQQRKPPSKGRTAGGGAGDPSSQRSQHDLARQLARGSWVLLLDER